MFARRIGHILVDHLGDPEGGGRRIEIERRADIGSQRASGRRGIQQHRAAGKAGRVDPAERDIGVGHGGAAAAPGIAGRPRVDPALRGPTAMRPRLSTLHSEPPPAPISTISTTGMRRGRPLPRLKR